MLNAEINAGKVSSVGNRAKKDDKLSAQLDEHSPASRLVVSEERSKIKLRAVWQRMNGCSVRSTG